MLAPAQPDATWGYVAASPFHSGFRYRRSATAALPAAAWSSILSPFQPLLLAADGTMSTLTTGPLVAAQPSA